MFAVLYKEGEIVRLLVDYGANVNEPVHPKVFEMSDPGLPRRAGLITQDNSVLPLDITTRFFNSLQLTRLLLDLGANPNKQVPGEDGMFSRLPVAARG